MNTKPTIDLYTDYLIASYGATTATGLSKMLNGDISHDSVTRFLSAEDYGPADLWKMVKSTVRKIEGDEGVLIFDDTIIPKPSTDESELICWHYDHCTQTNVKGINLLNAVYSCGAVSVPVSYHVVTKETEYSDVKTRSLRRMSETSKNTEMLAMFHQCCQNQLKFTYVLMDKWFASNENFKAIHKAGKHFIVPLKSNRLIALSHARLSRRSLIGSAYLYKQRW